MAYARAGVSWREHFHVFHTVVKTRLSVFVFYNMHGKRIKVMAVQIIGEDGAKYVTKNATLGSRCKKLYS